LEKFIKCYEREHYEHIIFKHINKETEKKELNLGILDIIIRELKWYKEELESERDNVNLGRPILSHLNPRYATELYIES